ncbi:MAG: YitT family protein [bacterium]|nr:YitT family protein [bacterium]
MQQIIEKIKKKNVIKRYIMLIISLFISAIVYNLFLLPVNLVTGGSGGIATITKYVYDIDPALMIMIISLACGVLSLLYLDLEQTLASIGAIIIYPLLVKLTSPITELIFIDHSDLFVIAIYSGIIGGVANGLMYKSGYSSGGLPVISQILNKYYKIPIATTSGIINAIIVIIGALFFGWTKAMYALILVYINSLVINKILLGISNNKAFYIITDEKDKVKDYIIQTLGHSVTIFDTKGGFLSSKNNVVLTVVPTREYYRVTEGIKMIDDKAFFVVTDAYEVVGGK